MVLYEIHSVKSRVTNTYVHWLYIVTTRLIWGRESPMKLRLGYKCRYGKTSMNGHCDIEIQKYTNENPRVNGVQSLLPKINIYWHELLLWYRFSFAQMEATLSMYSKTLWSKDQTMLQIYGCFESYQFQPRSVFFVSWRLKCSA